MLIKEEVLKVLDLKKKKSETSQQFLERVTRAADRLSDGAFYKCTEGAQKWMENAVRAMANGDRVRNFPKEEEVAKKDKKSDKKSKKVKEREEEEEEEEEAEEKPSKKSKKKKEEDGEEEEEDGEEEEEAEEEEEEEDGEEKPSKKSKKKKAPEKTKDSSKGGKTSKKKEEKKPSKKPSDEFPANGVIKVLAKKNPGKPGTRTFKKFAIYKSGMTVAAYLKKGKPRYLRKDIAKGLVKIVKK